MANVKYRVREFTPSSNQIGSHSFYCEAVADNIITNRELAKKIEARGLSRAAEIRAILEELSNIILEECSENNRVQLESGEGILVSIYPKVSGSISDVEVQANPLSYNNAQAATEEMLTPEMMKWTLGASIGSKFSKQFAIHKKAQKVPYNPNQTPAAPADSGENGGGEGGGGSEYTGGGLGD
jgi:hypothetical protein